MKLCQILLQIFLGQLIVCILINHELQNQEIDIFRNLSIAVHKGLSQAKVLKYGMKSHVRFSRFQNNP